VLSGPATRGRSVDGSGPPAAETSPIRTHKLLRHSGRVDGPIEYIVVEPTKAAADIPLVVALHGWGDSPERFAGLAEQMDLPVRTIVARGRQAGSRRGRGWLPQRTPTEKDVEAAVADLETLLGQLARTYPKSPKPIVYGFSQGGMLALELVSSKPSCCAGVAALAARLIRPTSQPIAAGKTPILLSAGTQDAVVPIAETLESQKRLVSAGFNVELVTHEGRHTLPTSVREALEGFIRLVAVLPAKKEPALQVPSGLQ
jgi:phospholipase/carboxylesterase